MHKLFEREYTPEDLLRLPDGPRYELIDGQLVEKPMGARSSEVAATIIERMGPHVRANHLGRKFGPDCGYQIFPRHPNRVRFPDVSFITRGRLPNEEVPEGHLQIRPDLAVEVVSPNDNAEELDEKVEEYLEVGVPLVWVVYPRTSCVMVFRGDGSVSRLRAADQLSGENVVPGFACRVADLFAGPG